MTIDLKFYKTDGTLLSLDKITGGIDFGVCKKNTEYIQPVVIKNLGDTNAGNLSIKASPLNSPTEVSTIEYDNQLLAATWKTFSLLPDEGFIPILSLGNLNAGGSILGKKKFTDIFVDPLTSNWTPVQGTGKRFNWTGSSLQMTNDGSATTYFARVDASGYGANKEIDFTTTFAMPQTATAGSAFVMFGFRMNCLGDERGYLINVKRTYNATAGTDKIFFEIRKGAGVKSTGVTEFGTSLFTSQSVDFVDYKPIRIKVFTNSSNLPEIKIWVGNIKDTDSPIPWGATNPVYSWVDSANTYLYAGGVGMYLSLGTGHIFNFTSTKMITDDVDGKVYIRTVIGDGSEDQKVYKSALELMYDPI